MCKTDCCSDKCGCHDEHRSSGNPYLLPAISFILLAAGMVMNHAGWSWFVDTPFVELCWYLVAFLPVALPVGGEALESFQEKDFFNEFTLMLVASIGAFFIGEYPEAVGVMLFYTVGEALQDKAVDRATEDISALIDKREKLVKVVKDGEIVLTDPRQVKIGDTIRVAPGESVALDGILEADSAEFDTAALTGESVPRLIPKGGKVLSGMISLNTSVEIRVDTAYERSTLSRIMDLVKDASAAKARPERFIRRFARVYTPIVLVLAVLIVAVPAIVGAVDSSFDFIFADWMRRALVFLVISCPCALVISVPLGYFIGLGAASRAGVLCKGGHVLDTLGRVNIVAFDKTGTLTLGKFTVSEIHNEGVSQEEMLSVLASAESSSTQPLARAVVNEAKKRNIPIPKTDRINEKPGFGVTAECDGRRILAGTLKLLSDNGVAYPSGLENVSDSAVFCAIDGEFVGFVVLVDTIKEDAVKTLEGLRKLHVDRLVMLSGDRKETVAKYARTLGLGEARGEMLPEDKARFVASLSNGKGNVVGFVGDGMNDAPVLALSDVGIAMGGLGSDAAIESADVVIQSDAPSRLIPAIKIARKTKAVIIENITGAIFIKVAVMTLAAIGFASLWAAVFADVGVALLAVANCLRIKTQITKNAS